MKPKTAIIASGGGTACSYGAGAMLALIEKYKFTEPDIIIGGSGSVGACSYYVAKQYAQFKNIWLNLICTKKFINHKRLWKIIDIDYVIDTIFKKQDPLDAYKVYSSKINYLIPATNHDTGNIEYFSNRKKDDIFEAMRASMALPIVYNKVVKINNKNYCDTYNSSCIQLNMLKAISLGAKKLIVIDNEVLNHLDEFGFDAWIKLQTEDFQKNYSKNLKRRIKIKIPKNIKAVFLKPKKELKIGALNNDKVILRKTFNQGYSETLNNKDLKKFLMS